MFTFISNRPSIEWQSSFIPLPFQTCAFRTPEQKHKSFKEIISSSFIFHLIFSHLQKKAPSTATAHARRSRPSKTIYHPDDQMTR